jgi:hypothetical protein
MTDISALREAIATNLATISGLRSSADLPDNPNPPIAVVSLESIDYDQAFNNGLTVFTFSIMVIVGRQSDRVAQRSLNGYASQSGASSIKTAVESDRSLDGNAADVRVSSMTSIGTLQLNDTDYLVAEFTATAYC